MPNITKAELERLEGEATRWRELAEYQRDERNKSDGLNSARIAAFDRILEDIEKAARGVNLVSASYLGHSAAYSDASTSTDPIRLTERELAERREQHLQSRIEDLESRLAAVVVVSQFARSHKA